MDAATRVLAISKAQAITPKIGYPDWIMNDTALTAYYADLTVTDNHFVNKVNMHAFDFRNMVSQLGQPVDRTVWDMTPQEVNAYYNPSFNEIVFPAGILQPPFFSLSQPKAINYGGIGAVMGHELTHGFDNSGREYDKYGNMRQWWSPASIAAFNEEAECLAEQYSSYAIEVDGQAYHVRGNQTLGENIADNGGLKEAYAAYHAWIAANGPEPMLPGLGLNNDQLFFVSFAQVWCSAELPMAALLGLRTDPHSPPQFRVQGATSNSEEFAAAFSCPAGSPMVHTPSCVVW